MFSNPFLLAFLATTILLLAFIPSVTAASNYTISNYSDFCSGDNPYLNTGSFHPWPKSILGLDGGPANTNMACWYYADCIYSLIPNTRQQQYSATGLVMGLIPLILKDVAWPQRRVAYIPSPQPWYTEAIVRGLGLNPVVTSDRIMYGKSFGRVMSGFLFAVLLLLLLCTYGALTAMEIYSKRSALGCPVPIFIVAWFIIAIIPAIIEVAASRYRTRNDGPSRLVPQSEVEDNTKAFDLSPTAPEGIQGSKEMLFVQFAWALYYTGGTLVFTSIMLVSVLELLVWFVVTCAATAASKMFAYKLCGYWGTGFRM